MPTILALFALLVTFTLGHEDYQSYNVLMVKDSNIQQLLSRYPQLFLFMHNPSCAYSEQYNARFAALAINLKQSGSNEVLGLVNCLKDPDTCNKYAVVSFPTVLKVSSNGFEQINQMKFINRDEKVEDQPYITSQIIEWLEQQPNYAVVVLEEEGMPIAERLQRERLVYLQPSLLYYTLFNMSNQRAGCWIYQYDKNNTSALKKYSCGSGVEPENIKAALENFESGRLEQYIYKTEYNYGAKYTHQESMNYDELVAFMSLEQKPMKLIYFDAQWCIFCESAGRGVSEAIDILKQQNFKQLQKFSKYVIDYNEVPKQKVILKLPYLELWFKNNNYIYQGKYDGISISKFIKKVIHQQINPTIFKDKSHNQTIQKETTDL